MGSKQGKDIGAERASELWRVYPEELTIVGLDEGEGDLLACYPGDGQVDQNARAAIVSCRDETRIGGPPDWFTKRLAMGGSPDPIACLKLPPDIEERVRTLVFRGRHRTIGQRELNALCKRKAERQKVDIKLLPLRGNKKMSRAAALIAQAGSNTFVPPSLQTRAAYALEMQEERLDLKDIITLLTTVDDSPEGQAEGEREVKQLLEWAEIFPSLGEEATRRANAGTLKLRQAKKLAQLRPKEQDVALQPKKREPPPQNAPRAASPARVRALIKEFEESSVLQQREILTVLRVLSGDAGPETLPGDVYAAWNRADERLKTRKP